MKEEPRETRGAAGHRPAEPQKQELESSEHQSDPATILQRATGDAASLSPRDVEQLQRTIGNRAVDDLVNKTAAPSSAELPVQRKIGNRGSVGAWVWWDQGRVNERGRIVRINKSWTPKASWKHKNVVREVKNYFVEMDEEKLDDMKVEPQDRDWYLTSPAARQRAEAEAEEAGEEEVKEAPDERMLSGGSKLATAKGVAGAGKALAAAASGYKKKTEYLEGNIDTAIKAIDKLAGLADKASHAFPPAKAVTVPLKKIIGGVNTVRGGVRLAQLASAPDGEPLLLGAFDEAMELLDQIPQAHLRSDEPDQIEKGKEALEAARAWLMAKWDREEEKSDE